MKSCVVAALVAMAPLAATAQDWTGAYGALGFANTGGGVDEFNAGVAGTSLPLDGHQRSIALGYNMQNGALVYGGELSISSGKSFVEGVSDLNYVSGVIDLKGRLGYATGKFLIYGTLGFAKADRNFANPAVTNNPVGVNGLSYGLGVDMMVSDRVFAGMEYLERSLDVGEGDIGGFPTFSYDQTLRSVGLRVGMRF